MQGVTDSGLADELGMHRDTVCKVRQNAEQARADRDRAHPGESRIQGLAWNVCRDEDLPDRRRPGGPVEKNHPARAENTGLSRGRDSGEENPAWRRKPGATVRKNPLRIRSCRKSVQEQYDETAEKSGNRRASQFWFQNRSEMPFTEMENHPDLRKNSA